MLFLKSTCRSLAPSRAFVLSVALSLALSLAGKARAETYPVVIEHAFGTTTLIAKPTRIATVNWSNHEVPLALGVVPVGFAARALAMMMAMASCLGSRRV